MTNSRTELREYARVQSACQLLFCGKSSARASWERSAHERLLRIQCEKSVAWCNFNQSMEWIESQSEWTQSI